MEGQPHFSIAVPEDAPALALLASEAWRVAYCENVGDANVELPELSHPGPLGEALSLSESVGVRGECSTVTFGFALLASTTPPIWLQARRPLHLRHFCVHPSAWGTGMAQALLAQTLMRAHEGGADAVWLRVWKANARAVAFFKRAGFVKLASIPVVRGTGTSTEWLLCRSGDESRQ